MKRFAPFLLLFLLLIPQHAAHADITSNLVGWWPFDAGTGTTAADATGNGNTGTLSGSTIPTWVTGKIGPFALNFNGTTAYVNVGSPVDLNLVTNFTVCAWFNPSALPNQQMQIVSKGFRSNNTQYQLAISDSSGDIVFQSFVSSVTRGNTTSTVKASIGTWTFACGSYDTTTYRLYTNGTIDQTTTTTGPNTVASLFEIGAVDITNTPGQFFPGSIDEVRVYNRVLTAGDVAELYLYTGLTTGHGNLKTMGRIITSGILKIF